MIQTVLRFIVMIIGVFCIFAGIGYAVMNTWLALPFAVAFWIGGWYLIQVSIHCTWNIKEIIRNVW